MIKRDRINRHFSRRRKVTGEMIKVVEASLNPSVRALDVEFHWVMNRMQHACSVGVDYELWRGNRAYRIAMNRDYLGRALSNCFSVVALGKYMQFKG